MNVVAIFSRALWKGALLFFLICLVVYLQGHQGIETFQGAVVHTRDTIIRTLQYGYYQWHGK